MLLREETDFQIISFHKPLARTDKWRQIIRLIYIYMKRHNINVFTLGKEAACSREELLQIRNKFIAHLQKETCLECYKCEAKLSKIVYDYSEDTSFCIRCFQNQVKHERHALLFVDLAIEDPIFEKWKLSQQLELMYLTHELGVQDTQLIAKNMSRPRSQQEIQQFYDKIGASRPFPPIYEQNKQERSEYIDQRKQPWYEMFQDLKQMLEQADNHVLDYMMAELHQRSDENIKSIIIQKYKGLTEERKQMNKSFQKLCKEYEERHKNPQIIFSSSSESHQSDISLSDPAEFEQLKNQSQNLMSKVDGFLLSYEGRVNDLDEKMVEEVENPKAEHHIQSEEYEINEQVHQSIEEKLVEIINQQPMKSLVKQIHISSPRRYKCKLFKKTLKKGILKMRRIERLKDEQQNIN